MNLEDLFALLNTLPHFWDEVFVLILAGIGALLFWMMR